MFSRSSPVYMPYGAYEMKASYQRNLTTAMLVTLGAVLCVVAAGKFWPAASDDLVITPMDPVVIRIRPTSPPSIQRDNSHFENSRPAAPSVIAAIPVPVADSLISDADDALLPTRDEVRWTVDQLDPDGGDGSGGFVIDTNQADFIPPPDSFIKIEVDPKMILEAKPDYPRLAEQAGITGTVWVSAYVIEDGNVLQAMVRKSSGTVSLDQAAVDAAYRCRYSPGIQNGRPVKAWVTYRVDFQLE